MLEHIYVANPQFLSTFNVQIESWRRKQSYKTIDREKSIDTYLWWVEKI